MGKKSVTQTPMEALDIPLARDGFMRTLLRHLSGTLEDVVGANEASGFVSVVGQKMGEEINERYLAALGEATLDRSEVTDVLVDLKRRIEGDFYVIEQDDDKIVLGNRKCPFGDKIEGRPSLCMMTSNVFGSIASRNLGYAKVELEKTIAEGNSECRIVVYLNRTPESEQAEGREYFKG